MNLEQIGGAVTSYLIASVALISDYGVMPALGAILLFIRLAYEGLRLYSYITKSPYYEDTPAG